MKRKSVVVRKKQVDAALRCAPQKGKRALEPFAAFVRASGLPFSILEDCETANEPEIHKTEGDLWHALEGNAAFVRGGKLKNPRTRKKSDGKENKNELFGTAITGGKRTILKPGDWLWIPAGVPHRHSAKGTARLVIIKIPLRDE